MAYNPEDVSRIADRVEKKRWWRRDPQVSEELADIIADSIGSVSLFRSADELAWRIECMAAELPLEKREGFANEISTVAKSAGWNEVVDVLKNRVNLKRDLKPARLRTKEIAIYDHAVRTPQSVTSSEDFKGEGRGPVSYWIPTKYDIVRYVNAIVVAHEASGRPGPVKVLDIGGGSGFMSKLLADELALQGVDSEVLVMDPDEKTVQEASGVYKKTSNMRFEVGTSKDALQRYGPKLNPEDQELSNILESRRASLIERGQKELKYIKAALSALEGHVSLKDALKSPFGKRVLGVLNGANISIDQTIEIAREAVADYYNVRFNALDEEILAITDQQEALYDDVDPKHASFDAVFNSWMPEGMDLSRDIRMLSTPAILYARSSFEVTGSYGGGTGPEELGNVSSWGDYRHYKDSVYWRGLAVTAIDDIKYDGTLKSMQKNVSEIRIRSGIDVAEERLTVEDPKEKYQWEASTDPLFGENGVKSIREMSFFSYS